MKQAEIDKRFPQFAALRKVELAAYQAKQDPREAVQAAVMGMSITELAAFLDCFWEAEADMEGGLHPRLAFMVSARQEELGRVLEAVPDLVSILSLQLEEQ